MLLTQELSGSCHQTESSRLQSHLVLRVPQRIAPSCLRLLVRQRPQQQLGQVASGQSGGGQEMGLICVSNFTQLPKGSISLINTRYFWQFFTEFILCNSLHGQLRIICRGAYICDLAYIHPFNQTISCTKFFDKITCLIVSFFLPSVR